VINIKLRPIIRTELDILFIGLNPGKISNNNGHYFSSNRAFWDQLYNSGLIIQHVDKSDADDRIFKSTAYNFMKWDYGITDLVPNVANSNSREVRPEKEHYNKLASMIVDNEPRAAVFLHNKVFKCFQRQLGYNACKANYGKLGNLISDCQTIFFNVPFPSGNNIPTKTKIELYNQIKAHLLRIK
jgi:G:T/U-mismatch repair DNA glycosylase